MSKFTITPSEGVGDTQVTVSAGVQLNRIDYTEKHRFYVKGNENIYKDLDVTKKGVNLYPTNLVESDEIEVSIDGGIYNVPLTYTYKTNAASMSWDFYGRPTTIEINDLQVSINDGEWMSFTNKSFTVPNDQGAVDVYNVKFRVNVKANTGPKSIGIIFVKMDLSNVGVYISLNQAGVPTISIDPEAVVVDYNNPATVQVTTDDEWAVRELGG